MFENDLKLDKYGNSVIKGGDFVLTDSDAEFIIRMLLTTPGSWKLYPELGVGLEQFLGKRNVKATLDEMRSRIVNFFKNYALFPIVTILPLEDESIICKLEFHQLIETGVLSLIFSFDLETASIRFYDNVEPEEIERAEIPQTRKILNRYFRRRLKKEE